MITITKPGYIDVIWKVAKNCSTNILLKLKSPFWAIIALLVGLKVIDVAEKHFDIYWETIKEATSNTEVVASFREVVKNASEKK